MGWTFEPRPADISDRLRRMYTFDSERCTGECLDVAIVALREAYLAVRRTEKSTGEVSVVAGVVAINVSGDEWGYKDMDETVGPNETNCPKRILDMLTPLPPAPTDGSHDRFQHARTWRAACQAKLDRRNFAKQIKPGDVIRCDRPLSFSFGQYTTFLFRGQVEGCKGRDIFQAVGDDGVPTGSLCRISDWRSRTDWNKIDITALRAETAAEEAIVAQADGWRRLAGGRGWGKFVDGDMNAMLAVTRVRQPDGSREFWLQARTVDDETPCPPMETAECHADLALAIEAAERLLAAPACAPAP